MPPNQPRCVMCQEVRELLALIPCCQSCWRAMSPEVRLSAFQSAQVQRQLSDILLRLDHLPDGASEVAMLAKAIENLTRVVKVPMDELDAIIGDLGKVVKFIGRKMQEDDDDGESWKSA